MVQADFENLLYTVLKQGASDLHMSVGRKPTIRSDGSLVSLVKEDIVTPKTAEEFAMFLLTDAQKEKFARENEIDLAYSFKDKARFRVNIFRQKGYASTAMRFISTKIKTIEELALPSILHQFTKYNQGFFLVVGPSGHGKSTTLAAILNEINHQRGDHIITIEDPIEYLFIQDRAIIDQREVGSDTESFNRALKSVFRQDPDVIMVGEMRDPITMATAMTAAETGHLVLSTLHTNNAAQTIDRIIDTFPSTQQNQIRSQLSSVLVGILSQRLIPRVDGGRVVAVELMMANSAIRNLIRENKIHQLDMVIETSAEEGMISLNRYLVDLVKRREISIENAEAYSFNSSELRILL